MKIAIMTFYESNVYGAVLQAAALRHYLVSQGHEADLIRYTPDGRVAVLPSGSPRAGFLSEAKLILKNDRNPIVTDSISAGGFNDFREKHLTLTEECITLSDLEKLNEEYDAFICGSGNIWSAATFDPHMFLDFVNDPGRMIAYAPSFLYEGGENDLTLRRIGELVKRFEHLSVREETGRRLMNDYYGIHTEEVADPVLLLTPDEWKELLGEDWEEFTVKAAAAAVEETVEEEPAEAAVEEPAEAAAAEEPVAEEATEEPAEEEPAEVAAEEPAVEETDEESPAEETAEPVTEEAFEAASFTLTETPEAPAEEAAEEPEGEETEEEAAAEEPAAEETTKETATEESATEEIETEEAAAEETVEEAEVEEPAEEAAEESFEEAPEEISDEPETVSEPEAEAEKGYLLSYFLSDQKSFRSSAKNLAERLELEIRQIPFRESDLTQPGAITDSIDPARLVNLVRQASYVCTDCYHVALLAIVFHKELCCFSRFKKGEYVGMNARMVHILDAVGLLGRLYDDNTPIEQYLEKTDFIPVQYKLNALRLKSGEFLTESLEAVETYRRCSNRSVRHVREVYTLCTGCGACAGVCPNGAISIRESSAGFLEAVVDENICHRCGKCTQICPMREEAEGVFLTKAQTLSYSDEDDAVRELSDGGALSYRLSRIFYDKGWAVAGSIFNEERRKAEHVLLLPEGVEAPWKTKAEDFAPADDSAKEPETVTEEEPSVPEETAEETAAMVYDDEMELTETAAGADTEPEAAGKDALEAEEASGEEALEPEEVPVEEALEPEAAEHEALEPEEVSGEEAPAPEEVSEEEPSEAAVIIEDEPEEETDPLVMLAKMQGTKLMQSDAEKLWEQIDMIDCPVLFFGTPCMCAAARKRFPDRDDIVYVDMVCSGMPSANLMSRYISAFKGKNNSGPCDVIYGAKNKNGESIIRISDGSKTRETVLTRDPMARLLFTGACSMESCYDCRWRERSVADIRMGKADASNLGKYNTDISVRRVADEKRPAALARGTFGYEKDDVTAILCMSDKGKYLLDQLMAEGYWEGLHKQDTDTYLKAMKKKNDPKPVYYKELMDSISDERVSFRKLINEYAKPIEKRSKSIERMQVFTHAGRSVVNIGDKAGKKEN